MKIIETNTGRTFAIRPLAKRSRPWFCTTGGGINVKRGRYTFALTWNEHKGMKHEDGTLVPPGFDLASVSWVSGGRKRFLATWYPVDGKDGPCAKFKILSSDGEDRISVLLLRRK